MFPREVREELARQTVKITSSGDPDLPYEFVKRNAEKATRHGTDFDALRHVLAIPGVEKLLAPDKPGVEPADPYALALAHHLNLQDCFARVITEDRRNFPDKLALASACGLAGVPVVPIAAFLLNRGIWAPA